MFYYFFKLFALAYALALQQNHNSFIKHNKLTGSFLSFQIFVFSLQNKPSSWEKFDWDKVTTVVTVGYISQELMCLAHSYGSRVVLIGNDKLHLFIPWLWNCFNTNLIFSIRMRRLVCAELKIGYLTRMKYFSDCFWITNSEIEAINCSWQHCLLLFQHKVLYVYFFVTPWGA